ncbi:MAG: ABC transporter permease [Cyanobacteria bacterium REEB65]|nr:ABC transporter permease [Cyanobacteria bacterium REEB65]
MRAAATRLALSLGVWLGVATTVFLLMYVLPADPARVLAGAQADPQTIAQIRSQLGLDRPLPLQFGSYLGGLIHGDWGHSYVTGEPVLRSILDRLPATLELALGALTVYLIVGCGLGIAAGYRPRGWADRLASALVVAGSSLPSFWLGLMLLFWLASRWPIFPLGGGGDGTMLDNFYHLALPALTLGIAGSAYYMRLLRQGVAAALRSDYVRQARAKGLSEGAIVFRHAVRNAWLPIVTLFGIDFAHLLGGAILTEAVFDWPGIGQQAMAAIATLDVPLIMGTVLFSATAIVGVNLLVDWVYPLIDPRLRR